jgi:hypothetical protein
MKHIIAVQHTQSLSATQMEWQARRQTDFDEVIRRDAWNRVDIYGRSLRYPAVMPCKRRGAEIPIIVKPFCLI